MTRWSAARLGIVLLTCVVSAALCGAERSGQWPAARKAYIASHPTCEACGRDAKDRLDVHHVRPVHLWPERENELDQANLITLCDRCHLLLGHLGDYKAFNPLAREDAARQLARIKARPYTREDAEAFRQRFATVP